ncbi:hypothetical protein CDV55_107132 [Aspergillus turcosus]|uniref:Uncharacterized protein n=1 Tax=Aspergillus turcosus TaxID=1245748 RepID=A0A229X6D9_9EURO|nr:hypothetical protein CDV55_107132 [Aspergillus turcosus]RLM00372.1 hypothetical protein CFD26_105413 [Aspergillus turcosus]
MAGLRPHEESITRVVWAAHILSCLTNTRYHEEQHEVDDAERDGDTDEPSDCETDYETVETAVLSGTRDSIRRKFLDCIAQLLSPCKGWDGVTATAIREGEDRVEVDIARNDGFLLDEDCFGSETVGYCKMLEEYLAGSAGGTNETASCPTEFELKVIDYTSRRIDQWIEELRKTRNFDQNRLDWNSQQWFGQEAAIEALTTMTDLILQFDADKGAIKSRPLIVQQAYRCLQFTQVRQLFLDTFGTQPGSKLWSRLNFISRPLVDCRLLRSIAAREPQFRNCKISLVSKPKTTLDARYVVGIFEAWQRLGLDSTPEPVARKLGPSSQRFEEACAESFSLHAEMQLVLHYDEECAHQPTLEYFGCSKKTCLLCETFLHALPSPIATRGRHGVCYPAWGVPCSTSATVEVAIERLEKSLVARIRALLNDMMYSGQKSLAANVVQSGMVSDFSHLTLEEWRQKEQDVWLFKDKQMTQRKDLLITRQYDEEDRISWTEIDVYPYLGTDKPFKGIMRIEHNPVRCRNLGSGFAGFAPYKEGYCVSLIHRDAYLEDGSTTNRSILASVRASCASTTPHEYRGPMIALQGIHHEDYADITLADFRHVMDYLVSYGNTHIRESVPDLHHRAPKTVRGVKICCYGEVKLHGSDRFVSVDVTQANQISLGSGSISPISVCLGMPIRLWKDPDAEFRHDPPGWEGHDLTADSNPNVAYLMVETDSSKDDWGWAPMYWNSEIGNVWAVRTDGQDLAADDVAMMCHFARRKLQRMFEDVMESGSSLVSRRRVSDFITWDNMITYWNETGGHEQFGSQD